MRSQPRRRLWRRSPTGWMQRTLDVSRHIFTFRVKEKTMNTRYVLTLCTALVIGGALITGSAHALSKTGDKTPITDTWLTAKTKIALFSDARVKGSEINVE